MVTAEKITPQLQTQCWDSGRLQINAAHSRLLQELGLTTMSAIRALQGDRIRALDSRETQRIELNSATAGLVVYLKRYGRPTWREQIVPWLRLSRPILGASAEWHALLRFHELGLPTMEPVAFGEDESGSFVMTRELTCRGDLKAWVKTQSHVPNSSAARPDWSVSQLEAARNFAEVLAHTVQRMHAAGMHHQDLYLNHVLDCGQTNDGRPDLRIIDLGRVRQARRLGMRWIIKDLAQLDFSAQRLPCRERLRFLRAYLGRRLNRGDRRLIEQIAWKSARIAGHTRKHRL